LQVFKQNAKENRKEKRKEKEKEEKAVGYFAPRPSYRAYKTPPPPHSSPSETLAKPPPGRLIQNPPRRHC
jgi:hypothetical protein